MPIAELNQENFESTVASHPFVVVDFWAPWCGPCRVFGPIFEEAAERHPEILFAKVNTEEQQALTSAKGIRSIPTLMIVRDQIVIYSHPGALSASQLETLINQARDLDMEQIKRDRAVNH